MQTDLEVSAYMQLVKKPVWSTALLLIAVLKAEQ